MIQREISDKRLQIDALDGLRGFAALIVIFSHTSKRGMFFLPGLDLRGTGKSGVFLFFLLSSFLLATPLLKLGKSAFTFSALSHYWQRRFFRIYPLYTLYLLLALVTTYWFTNFADKPRRGIPFRLNFQEFIEHIFLMDGKGVTWSIAVEFKFYFFLPILAFVTYLIKNRLGAMGGIIFLVLLIVLSQVVSPQSESRGGDARLLPYMPIFLLGIILVLVQEILHDLGDNAKAKTILRVLGYVGMAGILLMIPSVYSLLVKKVGGGYFHKQFILSSLCWALVMLSAINVDGFLKRFFTWRPLRFYGALSFSIYLIHYIFATVLKRQDLNGYLSAWIVLIGSTIVAYISFKLVEVPTSKFKLENNKFLARLAPKRGKRTKLVR